MVSETVPVHAHRVDGDAGPAGRAGGPGSPPPEDAFVVPWALGCPGGEQAEVIRLQPLWRAVGPEAGIVVPWQLAVQGGAHD